MRSLFNKSMDTPSCMAKLYPQTDACCPLLRPKDINIGVIILPQEDRLWEEKMCRSCKWVEVFGKKIPKSQAPGALFRRGLLNSGWTYPISSMDFSPHKENITIRGREQGSLNTESKGKRSGSMGFSLLLYTALYSPYTSTIPKTRYFQNMHAFWKYALDHTLSLSGTSFLTHWSVKLTPLRLNLPIISFRKTELVTPSLCFYST